MFKAADDRADAFHGKLMQRMDVFESNTSTSLHLLDQKADSIETQTKKTNGSVADINRWRERMNGMGAASAVFMTLIVMPILVWSIVTLVNIKETIHQSIDDALSAYEITKQ